MGEKIVFIETLSEMLHKFSFLKCAVTSSSLISRCEFSLNRSVFARRIPPSSPSTSCREERVVVTDGGAVIACWHPKPSFPYSLTRPLERVGLTGASQPTSPLNTQVTEDMKELYHFKPERLQRRDLMRMTWTTKLRWFPSYGRKYVLGEIRKDRNPREKPYF